MSDIQIKKGDLYFVLGLIILMGVGFASAQFGHPYTEIEGIPDDASIICTSLNSKTVQGCGGCGDGDDPIDQNLNFGFVKDPGEKCDDGANNGIVCNPGYGPGLSCEWCSNDCQVKTLEVAPMCGDSVVDTAQGETCDLDNFGGLTCADFLDASGNPFTHGDLGCSGSCAIDIGLCYTCGNGHPEGIVEQCDEGSANTDTPPPAGCESTVEYCSTSCTLESVTNTDSCPVDPFCGDGVCNGGETCSSCSIDDCSCPPVGPPPTTCNPEDESELLCNGFCPVGCNNNDDPDCGTGTCTDKCLNTINNAQDEVGMDCGGSCVLGSETSCTDDIDNDKDCLVDCYDPDCNCMYGQYNSLAKQGPGGIIDTGIWEKDASVGFGHPTPNGKMQVFGDEMRIGANSPLVASGSGDLYVQKDLEVGEFIEIGDMLIRDFDDHLIRELSGSLCIDEEEDGKSKTCQIGPIEEYRYCAFAWIEFDRGHCVITTNGGMWMINATKLEGSGRDTMCQATCLRTGPAD